LFTPPLSTRTAFNFQNTGLSSIAGPSSIIPAADSARHLLSNDSR
jgi:hypothetical protein